MSTATLPRPMPRAPRAGPTSCPANIQETKIAFGYAPQPDLATINLDADLWSLTKTNPALGILTPNTETDALDIGKGDEFPTTLFPSHLDGAVPVEKYTSSEFAAHTFCFATGKASKTGDATTGFAYSAILSDPSTDCINLAPFSYVEQIRAEPDSVVDRALIGCVINDFTLTMASGPGRANCKMSANWVGTGRYAAPSGVLMPAVTPEHFLNAASAAITINGINYTLGGGFISLEFRYNNNVRLPSGFYPGSGEQNGYAVRGRMEYGTREITLSFVARATKGSPELTNLLALTEGPLLITLTGPVIGAGPATHGLSIAAPRTVLSGVVNGDTDGIVNVTCQTTFMKPATGDMLTMEATTGQDRILGLAA